MIASTQTNSPLAGEAKNDPRPASLLDSAVAGLKAAGLRVTQPRMAILASLCRQQNPASIETIHADVGMTTCDLVTVYRCMGAFERVGLVSRGFFHNGTAFFRLNLGQPQRLHLMCKNTSQVIELAPEISANLQQAIAEVEAHLGAQGYREISHLVEFFATAPAPAAARGSSPVLRPVR